MISGCGECRMATDTFSDHLFGRRVPDTETRELMNGFCRGLKKGNGKLASLHAAQTEMLQRRRAMIGAAHPFYWASFVLVGDPNWSAAFV